MLHGSDGNPPPLTQSKTDAINNMNMIENGSKQGHSQLGKIMLHFGMVD